MDGCFTISTFIPTVPRTRREPVDSARTFSTIAKTVKDAGLLRRAQWFYALLGGGLFLALGGVITGFVLLGDSWFQLLMAAALGIIFTQYAFMAHEAAHRQVMASGPSNDRVGRFLGVFVVGMSYSWWMNKHTRHHANPNQIGRDPDIDPDVVVFLDDDARAQRGFMRKVTAKQGWLFYPLLTFEGYNLHYHSLRWLFQKGKLEGRWLELSLIALRFALYLGAIFAFLPLGMAFAFVGVQMAVFGFYMGSSFAVNHIGMPIIPAEARLDFFRKQVLTSRNVSGGVWANALLGGLNYQVEHHLFPNMARPYLARARKLVMEYSRQQDIPYTEMNLARAHVHVAKYINQVGLKAKEPFVCPVMAAYR